jgi:TPR repeat protein
LSRQRALRDLAEHGDPAACLELARQYQSRMSQDPAYDLDYRHWLERSADAGSAQARFELAFIHFRRADVRPEDLMAARGWLLAAADQRHRYALSNAAHFLTTGQHGFEIDPARARSYASTLVEVIASDPRHRQRELSQARSKLAWIEEQLAGHLAWTDGLEALQAGAEADDAQALYQLAQKHAQDVHRGDRARAEDLMRRAAERGHPDARYRVASRVLSQPRTDVQEAEAYAWMQDAAGQNHRGALVFMGRVFLRGLPKHGIARDTEMARAYLERALAGLEGDVVHERRSGSVTVSTRRESVERLLGGIEGRSNAP